MELTDRAILDELEQKIFAPAAVEEGIRQAVETLRPVGDALEARRVALKVELAEIAEKVRRLTEAIETGGADLEAVVSALKARQKRQRELQGALAELESAASSGGGDAAEIERELRRYLADWQGLLRGQPIQARQMIRKLLTGRLIFTPDEDDLGRFYTFEGRADRLQPIRGTVRAARALVTPGGLGRFSRALSLVGQTRAATPSPPSST